MPEMVEKNTSWSCSWFELEDSSCALDSSCTFSIALVEGFVVIVVLGILGFCTLY